MAGSIGAADSWFNNPAAQASANFGIAKTGEIHCYVDPDGPDSPWANGILNHQDAAVATLHSEEGGANPNLWTISIEHEGQSGDALEGAQLAASAQLTAWLCDHFAIPANRAHILGHYEFDDITRPNCPGWSIATWELYMTTVSDTILPPPTDPCADLRKYAADAKVRLVAAQALLAQLSTDVESAIESLNF